MRHGGRQPRSARARSCCLTARGELRRRSPAYDSDRNRSLGGKQTADAARNWPGESGGSQHLVDRTCKGIVVAIEFDFGRLNVGLTALTRTEKIEFFGFVLPKLFFLTPDEIITSAALFACTRRKFLAFAEATLGGHLAQFISGAPHQRLEQQICVATARAVHSGQGRATDESCPRE